MPFFITTQTLNRKEAMRRINLLAGKDLRTMADEYRIPVWKNGHETKAGQVWLSKAESVCRGLRGSVEEKQCRTDPA